MQTIGPRTVLLSSLALLWLNFLTTARWADVPGALRGPKWPLVAALLGVTTALALRWKPGVRTQPAAAEGRWVLVAGLGALVAGILVWFPTSVWTAIPYLDNWATRYRSTLDGLALVADGTATGWNWFFLGGYQTSSDITQNLAALAALPVAVFGPAVGFHVLHALIFLSLPGFVLADVRLSGDRTHAAFSAGLTGFAVLCFSYLLVRSGDTNSLAGLSMTMLAIVGAHAAAAGRRWGGALLVVAMALVAWSHVGFLAYAGVLLALDAWMARDGRRLVRGAVAVAAGALASLPFTWESWRYSAYFLPNNIIVDRTSIDLARAARDLYYNVEMLAHPHRWVNDFTGLTMTCLPIVMYVAWRDRRSRAGFFAAGVLVAVAMARFNSAEFAYVFLRPVHLLGVLLPPVIAWFLIAHVPERRLRVAFVALVAAYLQVWWQPVPHVPTEAAVEPALVERLKSLDGALVVVENAPHRDMDLAPGSTSQRTPFGAHFESLLPGLTGRRLYAGMWDGWQWTPARLQVIAAGTFRGQAIEATPVADVVAELRRWGVRHLLVWSDASRRYFGAQPAFVERWSDGRWTEFELLDADTRDVVTATGRGALDSLTPSGASVRLEDVGANEMVVVRTNFHPSWTAWDGTRAVALFEDGGQLAFHAPRAGSYDVALAYPKRSWLLWMALASVLVAIGAIAIVDRRISSA